MQAEKREKATPNCGDCGNSRPRIGRNLSLGREKRKCLPRFGQRAGVASAGEVLKRDKYTAFYLVIPADCPN
jgi:hypothetical protein